MVLSKFQFVCELKHKKARRPTLQFRRVPRLFLGLFIHIHRHAGPKFHGEFVLVDGDLLDELPDICLCKFCDFRFLDVV